MYRAESPQFRAWLDRAAAGRPVPDEDPSLDAAPRAVPLGVTLRREPDRLREEALALGGSFTTTRHSILSGVIAAGAVAASCFGQSGRDLITGIVEITEPAARHPWGRTQPRVPNPAISSMGCASSPGMLA